jgi:hypothetical protein
MGGVCFKGQNNQGVDLRDDKTKKEYYLNMTGNGEYESELGAHNYDITEKKLVGYGHI